MNPVLHHFRKEVRWLLPRWGVFLAVLGFDLVMSLGWVLPMKVDASYGLYELMTALVWMVALWVGISGAPEDSTDGGRAFTATRPLARWHYWLARLLVWLLLVALPIALETGLYLVLAQRPWSDVGLGMAEQVFVAGSVTLWVLPAVLLFRSWQRYVALVVFFAVWVGEYGRQVLTHVFKLIGVQPIQTYPMLEPTRFMQSAWLVGPLMVAVLIWHQRRGLSLFLRLSLLAVLLILCQGIAVLPMMNATLQPLADAVLLQHLKESPPEVHTQDILADHNTDNEMKARLLMRAKMRIEDLPRGVVPSAWDDGSIFRQKGSSLPSFPLTYGTTKDLSSISFTMFARALGGDLPAPWPVDALTMDSGNADNTMYLPYLPDLKDQETPVEVDMHWGVHWTQMRELGHVPLKIGSRIQTPEAELEIVDIEVGMDGRGSKSPTTITLTVKEGYNTLSGQNSFWPLRPMLMIHALGTRLIWQKEVTGFSDLRAMRHGWIRALKKVSFGDVLRSGTGVTRENLSGQQLVWIKPDYLGSTRHESKITGLRLSDRLKSRAEWPSVQPTLRQREDLREEFLLHIRHLKRPAVNASREEIAGFVAAVMSASHAYKKRNHLDENFEPKCAGIDREMGELLAPYIVKHPELLTKAQMEVEAHVLGAILLHAGIPGFHRGEGDEAPFYQQLLPEPGKPGVFKSLQAKPWWQGNIGDSIPLVIAMLKSGTDEAFRPFLNAEKTPIEVTWHEFQQTPSGASLRVLAAAPEYREKALRELNRHYAGLPHRAGLDVLEQSVVVAKAVAGDAMALEWLLRWWSTRNEKGTSDLSHICGIHQVLFGQEITPREVPALIRASRLRSAKDYHYDAEKMIWELLP